MPQKSHAGKFLLALVAACVAAIFFGPRLPQWFPPDAASRPANRALAELPAPESVPPVTTVSLAEPRPQIEPAADAGPVLELAAPKIASKIAPPSENETAEGTAGAVEIPKAAADAPQEPAVVGPSAAQETALKPSGGAWPQPRKLLAYLERLSDRPATGPWASDVTHLVQELGEVGLTGDGAAGGVDVAAALRQQAAIADQLATQIDDPALRSDLRRAQHALVRRLDVWQRAILISAARKEHPVGLADDAEALAASLAKVEALERRSPHGAAWREYLLLDSLRQLAAADPVERAQSEAALAQEVLLRIRSPQLSAAQRKFLADPAVTELERLMRQAAARPVDPEDLAEALEQYEWTGLPSDAYRLADNLRQLSWSEDPSTAAAAMTAEAHYRARNVRFVVSQDLLNRLLPDQKPLVERVCDTVLGMPVEGRSRTVSDVSVRVVPGDRARLELQARGQVSSSTSSTSGMVTAYSRTYANFTARRVFELTPDGVVAHDVQVDVDSRNQLDEIETPLDGIPILGDLVRGFAESEHESMESDIRAETESKIAARARRRIQAQADPALEKFNTQLVDRVLRPMAGLGLDPGIYVAPSGPTRLAVYARLAAWDQLGAHTPRPRALQHSLASVQIHQTAMNNLLEQLHLNGKTMTPVEVWKAFSEKLRLNLPAPGHLDDEDVTLTFAERDAVTVQLTEGRIEMVLAIAELKVPQRRWQNLRVFIDYVPQEKGPAFELVRNRPVGLVGDRLTAKSQLILRGIFSGIFPTDQAFPILYGPLTTDPRLKGLETAQVVIEDGWLGFCLVPQSAAPMRTAERSDRAPALAR
ncbi:MAG: hypothetical protein HYS13_16635 [Planctomycetia bacterium]|nr:hypothetical protein [Planctomycetia bacterium]